MPRRLTVAQKLSRIHGAGFTDAQIAAATGRGKSYIQKVRTGTENKPGESLAPAVSHLYRITRERKHPTAKPLPRVAAEAPRRAQHVRPKERLTTPGQRVLMGPARRTGKFHAYHTLQQRILRAAGKGERVRLTTNWHEGQWMGGHGGKPLEGVQYTLFDDGIDAATLLELLEQYGWWDDPAGALAALIAEVSRISETYLRVHGFSSYSLQIYERGYWETETDDEWT